MKHPYKIIITTPAPVVALLAVNLAHVLGFESCHMQFPIVVDASYQGDAFCFYLSLVSQGNTMILPCENGLQVSVPDNKDAAINAAITISQKFQQLVGISNTQGREAEKIDFISATSSAQPIDYFDTRPKKGLESFFSNGFILQDNDNDLLPDSLHLNFMNVEKLTGATLVAACNFAARLGMETTGLHLPITENSCLHTFSITEGQNCLFTFTGQPSATNFILQGNNDLVEFSSLLCENFPLEHPGVNWIDILKTISKSLQMNTVDGQIAYAKAFAKTNSTPAICYASPKIEEVCKELTDEFANIEFKNHRSHTLLHKKEYTLLWEIDQLKQILEEDFWNLVQAGDELCFSCAISEDKQVRQNFATYFHTKAQEKGAIVAQFQLVSAYKQGYSWLEEYVLPKAAAMGKVASVSISVLPFQKDGEEWDGEGGAVPNYNSLQNDDAEKWYDLPIRFLQELYPIDDVAATILGIERKEITFSFNKNQAETYQATFYADDGTKLLQENYTSHYFSQPYLYDFPCTGKVHPPTGYVQASINGSIVVNQRIQTDIEQFWQIYQQEILPFTAQYCQDTYGENLAPAIQPLFSKMQLEITMSEPDYNIPYRQDRISALDALHEDIYFAGLDYFKMLGNQTTGAPLDAPGLILPIIKNRVGPPSITFSLWQHLRPTPCLESLNNVITPLASPPSVYIQAIGYQNGKLTANIMVEGLGNDTTLLPAYTQLLEQGVLALNQQFKHHWQLCFEQDGKYNTATIQAISLPEKNLSIQDISIPETSLIHYEKYLSIIQKLQHVPRIAVYPIAETYEGRDIYAIELLPSYKGYLSQTKRINRHPVEVINARHHANEISSTNAAFMLLKKLLQEEEFQNLAEEMTLVIIPFENADGAEIHYQLQKDNPEWKLHAARFNATGKEFYLEYFNDDTPYTEALGFTKIWRTFLPDIAVDNHGVPKHEWDQPFSGYTSPVFKGFWLPRSLLYGYFWYVTDKEFINNYHLNKAFETIVADAINNQPFIVEWNNEWQNRFETYAHSWMPNMFPADYYKGMINYWVPFAFDIQHRYPSVRYPWITSVAYTSEVADETAIGDYLAECAAAHVCHDIAVLQMVRSSKSMFNNNTIHTHNNYTKYYIRQRPIIP